MSEAGSSDRSSAFGAELERVLHEFEQELAEAAPSGRRHARPDGDAKRLAELRMNVIREVEALPRAVWPRPVCEQCEGQREVQALQARYSGDADAPEFDPASRMCPACSGTGLTLEPGEQ